MNYRRLEHDLYWGYRLFLLRDLHAAKGFRGLAKGKGFRAYLEAEKIPPRMAYRLIKRYVRFRSIRDRVLVANEEIAAKVLSAMALPADALERLEAVIQKDLDIMCDAPLIAATQPALFSDPIRPPESPC
jgi:hypothetical protein